MKFLFRVEVFLAAALLFLAEPMAARQLLPRFGGSAAVWITCLVFFQLALLGGYLYAHWLSRRGRMGFHLVLLVAAVATAGAWALGTPAESTAGEPVPAILLALARAIGVPFLLLGATSPLLQVWQARLTAGAVPYRLYGLSNVASLAALLAYPTVVEPHLTLHGQRILWAWGVALFAAVGAFLTMRMRACPVDREQRAGSGTASNGKAALTFLLPLVAALQLSAVTQHLTSNVAAIPLLWILPLAVYLLTFIAAFQDRFRVPRTPLAGLAVVLLVGLGQTLTHPELGFPILVAIPVYLLELAAACLLCHSELYRLRPDGAGEATRFYLLIAAGGATGSLLVGIVAPLVFRANYDLSLTFALTAGVAVWVFWGQGVRQRLLWAGLTLVLAGMSGTLVRLEAHDSLVSVRNFYGSLRVTRRVTPAGFEQRTLSHGTITHGTEIFTAHPSPTTYYGEDSGVGLALTLCCESRPRKIGVVGLGAGTLAAYGRAGDRFRFYEINPAVLPIAQNLFTYLRQSPAAITHITADGRAALAGEPAQGFDVLVLDAFSGDAIPLHLLTTQAMAVYGRHLAPGGVLAFHISNQYLDLEPELHALAVAAGLEARGISSEPQPDGSEFKANWVLMTRGSAFFEQPGIAPHVHALHELADVRPWTDDYATLLPLLRR